MKTKRKIVAIFMLVVVLLSGKNSVIADTYTYQHMSESMKNGSISIYGKDVIVTKFRQLGGKYQYRRWNETKECWVDPYWIDF